MSGEVKNKERAMQTIFVATDRDGVCFVYWAGEPLWDGSDFGVGYGNAFCRYSGPCTPPPGECREYQMVPVEELSDDDAGKIKDKIIDNLRSELAEVERELADERASGGQLLSEAKELQAATAKRCGELQAENLLMVDEISKLADKVDGLSRDLQLAQTRMNERSPGMMPECVKEAIGRLESPKSNFHGDTACAKKLRDHFAPTDGHRWEPVDADHPITAADVGRQMCFGPMTVTAAELPCGAHKISGGERYILRPIAPQFVFAGEPGRYVAKWDDNETPEECEIRRSRDFPLCFIAYWSNDTWTPLNSDGTFPGGRITGRVM